MTKVKSGPKRGDQFSNKPPGVKGNAIHKNKNNKSANMPANKVRLVNEKKEQYNEMPINQLSHKQLKERLKNLPDSIAKNFMERGSQRNNNKSNKQAVKGKKHLSPKSANSNSVSANDSNDNIPDILGNSLKDSTDEDDTDFVEDEEPDEDDEYEYNSDADNTVSRNKGVKMFKGIKDAGDDSSDETEDDDDESDDGILEFNSSDSDTHMWNDDDDDEDDDDDDDDDDEDEDEEDEDEESGPGLKDLLATSIATDDDEDDEDFEGEDEDDEDIDISDESDSEVVKKVKKNTNTSSITKKQPKSVDGPKQDSRTIFISNIPKELTKEEIRKNFKKFGEIESVRERGVVPEDLKTSKKVAAIQKKFHPKVETVIMFIVYKSDDAARKAITSMNGKQLRGNYLRVDYIDKNLRIKPNEKKAVFLGNLPFTINDNHLWEHFKQCGEIQSVRLIRNKHIGIGKGIGYVNFKNEDSVSLALELNGSNLLNREIRVKRYSVNAVKEKKFTSKNKRSLPVENKVKYFKKFKSDAADGTTGTENGKKKLKIKNKQKNGNSNVSEKKATAFQGQKANAEKKKKKKRSKTN